MATVPMYQPTLHPDAWHDVAAPGGYEWWYFDAEDRASDTQIVAIFLQGFPFHPAYLRAYYRYLRAPTRHTPPVAGDYLCAYFAVYQKGKVVWQFMTRHQSFTASRDRADVAIGPNRLVSVEGAWQLALAGQPWQLTWQGPKLLQSQSLSAALTFRSELPHPPAERLFFTRNLAGAEHQWVIAGPRCAVSGAIQTPAGEIAFNGMGYHDHNYGTGPIGPGLSRWIWGRLFTPDGTAAFHYAEPRNQMLKPEVHLLHASPAGIAKISVDAVQVDWTRLTGWGLSYPGALRLGDQLILMNPTVIDSTPFYLRLRYDGQFGDVRSTAFCEVAHPHRLRWPILGRMVEMSIFPGAD